MGKEETKAREHPTASSLQMLCWDLLSQRLGLWGHTLPELALGPNIKKTSVIMRNEAGATS